MTMDNLTEPTLTDDSANVSERPRRGGRGCRACGSHRTQMLGKAEQICRDCGEVWAPCAPYCRGYRLDVRADEGPTVIGCPDCGVPTRLARHWPEAWRALARELAEKKLEPVDE